MMKLIPVSPQLNYFFISVGSSGRQSIGTSGYWLGPQYVEALLSRVKDNVNQQSKAKLFVKGGI